MLLWWLKFCALFGVCLATSQDPCVTLTRGDPLFDTDIEYDAMKWFETPSVVSVGIDRYQVTGRNVHMHFVQEHLQTKKNVDFGRPNNIELEILADTVYVQGDIKMRGIKVLTIFSRKMTLLKDSRLDLRAPDLKQSFKTLSAGDDGDDGYDGVDGPTVEIFADTIEGYMNVITSGGNGNQGQNGADGRKGADSLDKRPDKTEADCRAHDSKCKFIIYGTRGVRGGAGGHGGSAGKPGNGGDAGRQTVKARRVLGKIELKTCRGTGGLPARNGVGGAGGQGGRGGRGIECRYRKDCDFWTCDDICTSVFQKGEAARGPTGTKGTDGHTCTTIETENGGCCHFPFMYGGKTYNQCTSDAWHQPWCSMTASYIGRWGNCVALNGQVQASYLQKSELSRSAMDKYPLTLLKLMTRHAEDLIWANNIVKAEAVLTFIVTLTEGRTDASEFRKDAKRRLAFLNKPGFDRFGNNKLFAPLMKWETYKKRVESIRDHAKAYENAYNAIQASIERQDNLQEVLQALPAAAKIQVNNEKTRLIEARRIAISEKGAYVASIKHLEASMTRSLEEVIVQLPDVYEASQFNRADLLAVLQGITGFFSGIAGKDPAASIGAAVGVAEHYASKCNTGTLQENLDKIESWMTFGEAYAALEDSSDLDFDKMDVVAVPEVMMANLEMNKEGLAADLVCMLDERSLPRNKAKFEEQIARFFIAGGARIDLIAKVIDLDNDIGGYNFYIANLEETSNNIQSLMETGDSPIAYNIQQTFLDDLLTSYGEMETSFTNHLYHFYKGFEFRSLWNVDDTLLQFERTATEVAPGTGSLQGVLQLTKALQEIDNLENKGRQCFTKFRHTTNTHKWSFDSVTHAAMFDQFHNGSTRLTLKVSDSCKTCYNVRLLKMYVELYGDTTQNTHDLPAKVHLKLRHMSGSYFRNGNNNISEFRQPLASWRKFEFNRFAITNTTKCNEDKKSGNSDSLFCMEEDDNRLQPMCCHYLSDSPCNDILLGAEECTSPFGTYEISLPIDENLPCQASSSQITHKNCKDFDRTIYTKMNVWIHYLYWTDGYPTGPDDANCKWHQKRKSESRGLFPKLAISLMPEV